MTSTVSSVDDASPNRSDIASPWKIGSARLTAREARVARLAVSEIHIRTPGPLAGMLVGTRS
ncbi:hypothetical protein AB3G45_00790 [Shinella sp. S4-D37]|uniref:hypothetical protein n=1 Tax=Shinella sp. S4-D37 TaxID=3161999 RepID=UPI003464FE70